MSEEILILASSSPRRLQLMELLGYPFQVCASGIEEKEMTRPIPQGVQSLAYRKARRVADSFSAGLVLGADTVVELDDEVMGKPADRMEAGRMLERLSGRYHLVYTGLALVSAYNPREVSCDYAVTRVKFRDLEEKEIENYLNCEDWADKAGAYAIQGRAAVFVESLEGCYFNVVGLPVSRVYLLLSRWGLQPSDYWRRANGVQQNIYKGTSQ